MGKGFHIMFWQIKGTILTPIFLSLHLNGGTPALGSCDPMHSELQGAVFKKKTIIMSGNAVAKEAMARVMLSAQQESHLQHQALTIHILPQEAHLTAAAMVQGVE